MGDTTVVGYVRVSTDGQGERGAGLEAQRRAIMDEAERRRRRVKCWENGADHQFHDRRADESFDAVFAGCHQQHVLWSLCRIGVQDVDTQVALISCDRQRCATRPRLEQNRSRDASKLCGSSDVIWLEGAEMK